MSRKYFILFLNEIKIILYCYIISANSKNIIPIHESFNQLNNNEILRKGY